MKGQNAKPEKQKLTFADLVTPKAAGHRCQTVRFEVPFVPAEVGKAQLDWHVTFFICTEKLCARQKRTVSVPVEVR